MSLCLLPDGKETCAEPDPDQDEAAFRREVGRRVRLHRALRALSQEDLGSAAGLSRAAVGRIERGAHKVDVWRLHLLGRALGVEVSVLLGERPGGR